MTATDHIPQHPARPDAWRLRVVPLLAAGSLLLSGCATGHIGTVAARYTVTDDALVLDAYNFGIEARPAARARGAAVGYGHTVYLFDKTAVPKLPRDGAWQWFHVALPPVAPLWVATQRIGLDLGANPDLAGLAFGYSSTASTRLPVDRSQRVELRYNPRAPHRAVARLSQYDPPTTAPTQR